MLGTQANSCCGFGILGCTPFSCLPPLGSSGHRWSSTVPTNKWVISVSQQQTTAPKRKLIFISIYYLHKVRGFILTAPHVRLIKLITFISSIVRKRKSLNQCKNIAQSPGQRRRGLEKSCSVVQGGLFFFFRRGFLADLREKAGSANRG